MKSLVLQTQKYWLDGLKRDLPKTILLSGEKGSGKHIIVDELAKHYNLGILDITDKISFDYLLALSTDKQPAIITVNLDEITDKKQNALLKFVEEPPQCYYIILMSENVETVLPTIVNRCISYRMYSYDYMDLKRFLNTDDEVTKIICKTPGDVELCNSKYYTQTTELAQKIVDKIGVANIPNVLSISEMVEFASGDKIPYQMLLRLVSYFIARSNYSISQRQEALKIIQEYREKIKNPAVSKKMAFDILLLKLNDCLHK